MSALTSHNSRTQILQLAVLLVVIFGATFLASMVQSDGGNITIEKIEISDSFGNKITGKLYIPDTATIATPQPAVLLLHGLNNDHETEGPASLELAKRGFVALALDELNHGGSDRGGSFLNPNPDATPEEKSLGGVAAFDYLQSLSYVQTTNIGVVGHSMGGSTTVAISQVRTVQATAFQAFGPLNLTDGNNTGLSNYLQIVPKWEESAIVSRDTWISEGSTMIEYNIEQLGGTITGDGYGVTYGDFTNYTAQRYVLIDSTHPGGTWKKASIRETVSWMLQALKGEASTDAINEADSTTYYWKEILTLLATLMTILSIIPLCRLLLIFKPFEDAKTIPSFEVYVSGVAWWRLATLNAWIGAISFILLPFIGVLILAIIQPVIPIFGLLMANGYLVWFIFNAALMQFLYRRWVRKEQIDETALGRISKDDPNKNKILLYSLVVAFLVGVYLYLITFLVNIFFLVELRYMWSFFKVLTLSRFLNLWVYFFAVLYFFWYNAGLFMLGQTRPLINYESRFAPIKQWLFVIYTMLSGLIVVFMIEYYPMMLFGTAPLLGGILGVFWLLGIFLMQIIPEFAVLFLLLIILYRDTGRIYIGAFIASFIISWVLVTGALI